MERPSLHSLGDDELLRLAQQRGLQCRLGIRQFVAVLPEIWKRGLNRRLQDTSMCIYGMKTGGAPKNSISRAGSIFAKLEGKPILTDLFFYGDISHEKIQIVSRVATTEDEHIWADRAQELSIMALRKLVQDIMDTRIAAAASAAKKTAERSTLSSTENAVGVTIAPVPEQGAANATNNSQSQLFQPPYLSIGSLVNLKFNPLVANRFLRYKTLFSAKRNHEFTDSELLHLLLRDFSGIDEKTLRAHDVVRVDPVTGAGTCQTKFGIVKNDKWQHFARWCGAVDFVESPIPIGLSNPDSNSGSDAGSDTLAGPDLPQKLWNLEEMLADIMARELHLGKNGKTTRHIPRAVRRFLHFRDAGLCVFPGCDCFARSLHHVKRYSKEPHHAPLSIYPLCDAHHENAHNGLIGNEQKRPETWFARIERRCETADDAARARIDKKVRSHRRPKGKPD